MRRLNYCRPEMRRGMRGVLFIVLFYAVACVNAVPMFTTTPAFGTVKEKANVNTQIARVGCDDTVTANPLVITYQYASPSYCSRCFNVLQDISGGTTDFFLYYFPAQGSLNFSIAATYTVRIMCTNGVDPPIFDDVYVQVEANQQPRLDTPLTGCPAIYPEATDAGGVVYNHLKTNVIDPEGDAITCTMTVTPDTGNFEIDPVTCEIRAVNALTAECNPTVTFQIMATDNNSPAVGPFSVTCSLIDASVAPLISPELNTTIQVDETTATTSAVGSIAYNLPRFHNSETLTYSIISAEPQEAASFFEFTSNKLLTVKEPIDYEADNILLRNIRLGILVDNSQCDPVYHYLDIQVLDVNEPPATERELYYVEVDEGPITINPFWNCQDEDTDDKCNFHIRDSDHGFVIDQNTGIIYHSNYDIDPNTEAFNVTLQILILDEEGLNDTAEVWINIKDINDNPPHFVDQGDGAGLAYQVTECTEPGILPNALSAIDDDSEYQGNNKITFLPIRSDCMSILSNGQVHLLRKMVVPESCSLQTRAVDQGFHPRQLTSTVAAVVSISVTECPTTAPATEAADADADAGGDDATGTTASGTGTGTVTGNSTNTAGTDLGLIFGILGGILGALLLASLLAWCCRRKCCGKKKTAPFSSEKTATKEKKSFEGVKKKKAAKAAAAAAPVAATAAAPTLFQRFLRVRRKVPLVRVKRRVPIGVHKQLVPIGNGPVQPRTVIPPMPQNMPIRSAPGLVRAVGAAPPPYRMSGTVPTAYGGYM